MRFHFKGLCYLYVTDLVGILDRWACLIFRWSFNIGLCEAYTVVYKVEVSSSSLLLRNKHPQNIRP